jgi:branched-chain amino acid transport system ATP-binding protein
MSANKEPLLRVEDIHISFGGLKALNNVSLDVNPGEIMAIIGPNGAGKTTMLNVINGVYTPDEGRIFFEGEERSLQMKPHHVAHFFRGRGKIPANETAPCGRNGDRPNLSKPGPF